MKVICSGCGTRISDCKGRANRKHYYCNEQCKRKHKAIYDAEYREKNYELLRQKKQAYHKKTYSYDKAKERRERSKESGYSHTEYCRNYMKNPKNKARKVEYDRVRRAKIRYGDLWEAQIELVKLQKAIRSKLPSWYERAKQRGYYDHNKTTIQRKRDAKISKH